MVSRNAYHGIRSLSRWSVRCRVEMNGVQGESPEQSGNVHGGTASDVHADSLRVAAVLLFIASALETGASVVLLHWGWKPSATNITEIVGEAVLGVCLLLFRRRAIVPALVFLIAVALVPLVHTAITYNEQGWLPFVVLFSMPLVLALLRVLPWSLLFFGRQTRARYATALVIFALRELIELMIGLLTVYASQHLRP